MSDFPPVATPVHDSMAAESDDLHDTRLPDAGPLPADVAGHAPPTARRAWTGDAFTAPAAPGGHLAAVRALHQDVEQQEQHAAYAFPGMPRRHQLLADVCGSLSVDGVWCRRDAGHLGECVGWARSATSVSAWLRHEAPAPEWAPEGHRRP